MKKNAAQHSKNIKKMSEEKTLNVIQTFNDLFSFYKVFFFSNINNAHLLGMIRIQLAIYVQLQARHCKQKRCYLVIKCAVYLKLFQFYF